MKKELSLLLLVIIAVLILSTFNYTDKPSAVKFLTNNGYTDITITGYHFFGCKKGKFKHTGFIAYKNEDTIEGTVCSGSSPENDTIKIK